MAQQGLVEELHEQEVLTEWDAWAVMTGEQLASEVARYIEPLLEQGEARNGLYSVLVPKPLERLQDAELSPYSDTLWTVKDETCHPGGAYKLRGAMWNILTQLGENPNISEVHCTSTGNHARGVLEACAWLNEQYGTHLETVVHAPEGISLIKLRALREGGATVVLSGSYEEAHDETEMLKAVTVEPGSQVAVVEPFDDPRTMAGQASCGFEVVAGMAGTLFSQEGVDLSQDDITLWVPGGGGGFAAGCAIAFNHYRKLGLFGQNVKIRVAQMEGCDALSRRYHGIEPLTDETLDRSNDATAILEGGSLTSKILADKQYIDDILSVPKAYVGLAMEVLERHHGYPVEPAGALSLAAALWYEDVNPPSDNDSRRVNITVTSGTNVTNETLTHFAAETTASFKFQRQSGMYLRRRLYGLAEVLGQTRKSAGINHASVVASGPTASLKG